MEKSPYSHYIYTTMAGQMLIGQLLIEECDKGCKGFFKEKLQKKIWIFVPGLLAITLIASLCIVVSVLHEKQKKHHMDCMLKPNVNSDSPITCLHVEKYPLSNEIYARICVNNTVQIDIRRFHNGLPSKEGISLSQMQWQYLKKSADHIDESILNSQKHVK